LSTISLLFRSKIAKKGVVEGEKVDTGGPAKGWYMEKFL
jgi:hypothetical protein